MPVCSLSIGEARVLAVCYPPPDNVTQCPSDAALEQMVCVCVSVGSVRRKKKKEEGRKRKKKEERRKKKEGETSFVKCSRKRRTYNFTHLFLEKKKVKEAAVETTKKQKQKQKQKQ